MSNITVTVEYLDHTETVAIAKWPDLPSERVQSVKVTNERSVNFSGASLYWIYPEEDYWVAGSASVNYDANPINEVLIYNDGSQSNRRIPGFPDMLKKWVKLGWWNGHNLNG